jgi:decaprenylphospho-beta-D-erythro-pentofuranosid-2-ulose 2-reductase
MNDALGAVQSVLVLGGGSEIALATVRRLAGERCRKVVLAGRDLEALAGPAKELEAAGVKVVDLVEFDALDFDSHDRVVRDVFAVPGDIDLVLVAFGVLGDQELAERDATEARRVIDVNFTGAVSAITPTVAALRAQGHGTIVVLSSVAGERARRSNYVYGASKAGLDASCQGLGDSLDDSGVRVMVVRPGFVYTKMTDGMTPAPLSVEPDAVAEAIVAGLGRGADTVWAPAPLRFVMSALRHVPRAVFRKLPI